MSATKPFAGVQAGGMRRRIQLAAPILLFALSGCGQSADTSPGEVSEGEARALDEAAEMLEERRLPDGALPPLDSATGEAQADGLGDDVKPNEMTGDKAE